MQTMPEPIPTHVLYFGEDRAPEQTIPLRAGPLRMTFQPQLAFLRHVTLGDTEILRGAYAAVRDERWGTVPSEVRNVRIDGAQRSFRVEFDVACRDGDIAFDWRGTVRGDEDGRVEFIMDGRAGTTFPTRRTGLCVLHPIDECAGRRCTITCPDGAVHEGQFPYTIAPRCPFTNIAAMRWQVGSSPSAEVRFEGEVFETEDQRNWTDASYKTYCRPHAWPSPYELAKGQRVRQAMTLRLAGALPSGSSRRPSPTERITLRRGPERPQPPAKLGLRMPSAGEQLSPTDIGRLRSLNLAHVRIDVDLDAGDWAGVLQRAAAQARDIAAGLEVAATASDEHGDVPDEFGACLRALPSKPARVLLFARKGRPAAGAAMQRLRDALSQGGIATPVGTGSPSSFEGINRRRPRAEDIDVACWGVTPQVHTFDDLSIIENLGGQVWTVRSARQFLGGTPIAVTPITLRPGGSPDPRQRSLLAGAWTVASIKTLTQCGAESLTTFETIGPGGVMAGSGDPFGRGCVFPVYHVLTDLGEFAGGEFFPLDSSAPGRVEGHAMRDSRRTCVLVANLTAERVSVRLPEFSGPVRLRRLDERNAALAIRSPEQYRSEEWSEPPEAPRPDRLELLPYAVVRVDWGRTVA